MSDAAPAATAPIADPRNDTASSEETPKVILVLAKILVRQALEEAGLVMPANDND